MTNTQQPKTVEQLERELAALLEINELLRHQMRKLAARVDELRRGRDDLRRALGGPGATP